MIVMIPDSKNVKKSPPTQAGDFLGFAFGGG